MEEQLQLATTRQLVDELFNRFEVVLLTVITKPDNGKKHGKIKCNFRGGTAAALGLCDIARDIIKEESYSDEDFEETPKDETAPEEDS